ncbi:MAG: SDR family NAD(P)-dependent oxidoreductase [Bacteroidales bacterium]|jgi:benzil reductase ((S)-benzoin forming)|nr:SDR family NAD(P)-dependent oxidoreductase [Bacteroidales bacterium]
MNYIYITGTSRGIGKAVAELMLSDANNKVIGISRECVITHKNYSHIKLDLSDTEETAAFEFADHTDAQKIILINNSGVLGPSSVVGNSIPANQVTMAFNVNAIAPAILMNNFVNRYKNTNAELIIINTSSGAGRHTIDGWSTYCATKAALDMYSMTIADEQRGKENPVKVYSVAPGIVDSKMQDEIRTQKQEDFPLVQKFIDYKKDNALSTPEDVAKKYLYIINNTDKFTDPIVDVRDF